MYPDEVVGIVLVDAAHEDSGNIANMPRQKPPPIPRSIARFLMRFLGQLGLMRVIEREPSPPPRGLTATQSGTLSMLRRQRQVLLAQYEEGPGAASAALARAAGGFGNLPLIVLTAGRPLGPSDQEPLADNTRIQEHWIALQRDLARQSSVGQHIVVKDSEKGLPYEAPEAVVGAVRDLVKQISRPPK